MNTTIIITTITTYDLRQVIWAPRFSVSQFIMTTYATMTAKRTKTVPVQKDRDYQIQSLITQHRPPHHHRQCDHGRCHQIGGLLRPAPISTISQGKDATLLHATGGALQSGDREEEGIDFLVTIPLAKMKIIITFPMVSSQQ